MAPADADTGTDAQPAEQPADPPEPPAASIYAAEITSFFVTQMVGHSGGFLGPSSAVDFFGQICSFMRVLTFDLSLRLRCPTIQKLRFIWTAHEAGL